MIKYLYCVKNRYIDGTVGPVLYTRAIEAPTVEVAIARARSIYIDLTSIDANTIYLKEAESGNVVWTLYKDAIDIDS